MQRVTFSDFSTRTIYWSPARYLVPLVILKHIQRWMWSPVIAGSSMRTEEKNGVSTQTDFPCEWWHMELVFWLSLPPFFARRSFAARAASTSITVQTGMLSFL